MANFSPLDAYAFVRQQGQEGQNRRVSNLQGQAINAPRDQRQALIGQIATVNPSAALETEGALQTREDAGLKRLGGFVRYVDQARSTGNMAAVNAALREGAPFISEILGKPGPTEWTPDMEPGWEALKAQIAMAEGGTTASNVQSTYVDAQGNRVAIMRDGTSRILGPNNQSIRVLEQEGALPYGVVTSGGRAGQVIGLGGPAQSGAQPMPQGAVDPAAQAQAFYQRLRSAGLDDAPANAATEAYLADMGYMQAPPQAPVGPVRTPTAGERAAQTEQAQQAIRLQYAPALERIETQGAIERAAGIEAAKTQAERAAAAPATIATLQTSIDSIDALLNDPNLGSVVGLGSMNPLNQIPGTEARGLIARADQVAGQAFLAAFNQLKGGGAITEREGAAATAAMARLDRSQNLADYRQALTDLKAAIQPAIERARNSAGQSTGSVRRARNPQTGEVLVLRNGQWVPE